MSCAKSTDVARVHFNDEEADSSTEADINSSTAGAKSGIGQTGFHFRWYKRKEFLSLSQPQRDKLVAYRNELEAKGETKKLEEMFANQPKKRERDRGRNNGHGKYHASQRKKQITLAVT